MLILKTEKRCCKRHPRHHIKEMTAASLPNYSLQMPVERTRTRDLPATQKNNKNSDQMTPQGQGVSFNKLLTDPCPNCKCITLEYKS